MMTLIRTLDDLQKARTILEGKNIVACDIEATALDIRDLQFTGIGVGDNDYQAYIPFPNSIDSYSIRLFFNNIFQMKEVILHNAKYDLQAFRKFGYEMPIKFHDTMIMSWLLDENRSQGLKSLTKTLLNRDVTKYDQVDQNITLFRCEEDILQDMACYCCEDVKNTFDLYMLLKPQIEQGGFQMAYEKVEMNVLKVLMNMEYRGIMIDKEFLQRKKIKAEEELKKLETHMNKFTSGNINIHSPKQLSDFLFNKMLYKTSRKDGKHSTNNETLKDIIKTNGLDDDSFVATMMKFRDLDKIYRTYLIALLEEGRDNGIIHTNFLQHGTRTGRLSCSQPNLQNIPSRGDEWDIRGAFRPRPGYKFIIADYSQIELRVLAHFSQDQHMVKTFIEDGDIHAMTMKLTGTERRVAKSINFGIVYGMGPRTLSQTLKISEEDAKKYINRFFHGYPSVRNFIARVQTAAIKNGWVGMLTGRKRRFFDALDSQWVNTVQRQAVNTKIQGSAADIIKIAMIRLDRELKKYDAHQLLQIHDELIIEAPEEKIDEVASVVRNTMENAVKYPDNFSVPLKVGMSIADHWIKG